VYNALAYGISPTFAVALQVVLVAGVSGFDAVIWAAFGFFGAASFLSFSIYSEHFPAALTGRVLTTANLFLFVAAFALQWGIGAIVDSFPAAGTGGHAASGHAMALGIALALELAAFAWMVWPRSLRG
jgi:hypothetical protein